MPSSEKRGASRRVRVRLFASLVETVGRAELSVDVAMGETVGDLWSRLADSHAGLARLRFRPAAACDLSYADWNTPLDGVTEVAFLPPVSGG